MTALNIDFKSKEVRIWDKNLLDPDRSELADDSEESEIPEPDTSSPTPIDTDITERVERDLYEDFYPDDNPDAPDPGLYRIIPPVKRKDISKRASI